MDGRRWRIQKGKEIPFAGMRGISTMIRATFEAVCGLYGVSLRILSTPMLYPPFNADL